MSSRNLRYVVVPACAVFALLWLTFIWWPVFHLLTTHTIHGPSYDLGYLTEVFGSYGKYSDYPFDKLTKRQPRDVQKILKPLIGDLRVKSYDDLIILKTEPNPCELTNLVDCRGIDSKIVKQYVEAALTHRQFVDTTDLTRTYNMITTSIALISLGSLIVSILALYYSRNLTPK